MEYINAGRAALVWVICAVLFVLFIWGLNTGSSLPIILSSLVLICTGGGVVGALLSLSFSEHLMDED